MESLLLTKLKLENSVRSDTILLLASVPAKNIEYVSIEIRVYRYMDIDNYYGLLCELSYVIRRPNPTLIIA